MKSTKRAITSTASCEPYWEKDGGYLNKWKETSRNFSDGGWDRHVNATSADTKKEVLEDGETREDTKVGREDRFFESKGLEREHSIQIKKNSSKTLTSNAPTNPANANAPTNAANAPTSPATSHAVEAASTHGFVLPQTLSKRAKKRARAEAAIRNEQERISKTVKPYWQQTLTDEDRGCDSVCTSEYSDDSIE